MADTILVFSSAYLAATCLTTGVAHLVRFGRFRRDLRAHAIVPVGAQWLVAIAVPLCELAIGAAAILALTGGSRTVWHLPALVASLALGGGFLFYMRQLLMSASGPARRGVSPFPPGSCGCSPLDAALTPLSLVPAGGLALVAAVATAAALAGGAATIGPADLAVWLLAGWGATDAALVLLLPASVGRVA